MLNARRVLPHAVIYERVWGYDFGPASNALRVYIGYLRRKLEVAGARPLVHTCAAWGTCCASRTHDAAHRIAAAAGLAVALAVVVAAVAVYVGVRAGASRRVDDSLEARADLVVDRFGRFGGPGDGGGPGDPPGRRTRRERLEGPPERFGGAEAAHPGRAARRAVLREPGKRGAAGAGSRARSHVAATATTSPISTPTACTCASIRPRCRPAARAAGGAATRRGGPPARSDPARAAGRGRRRDRPRRGIGAGVAQAALAPIGASRAAPRSWPPPRIPPSAWS